MDLSYINKIIDQNRNIERDRNRIKRDLYGRIDGLDFDFGEYVEVPPGPYRQGDYLFGSVVSAPNGKTYGIPFKGNIKQYMDPTVPGWDDYNKRLQLVLSRLPKPWEPNKGQPVGPLPALPQPVKPDYQPWEPIGQQPKQPVKPIGEYPPSRLVNPINKPLPDLSGYTVKPVKPIGMIDPKIGMENKIREYLTIQAKPVEPIGMIDPKIGMENKIREYLTIQAKPGIPEPDRKPAVLRSFKSGGRVNRTGIYKLHKGEKVLTKKQAETISKLKKKLRLNK